jgi:hypothetical protein
MSVTITKEPAASFFRVKRIYSQYEAACTSEILFKSRCTMKTEEAGSSETLVRVHQKIRRYHKRRSLEDLMS